jgi:hypothetical protein
MAFVEEPAAGFNRTRSETTGMHVRSRTPARRKRRHDEESRRHALEVVERLAEEARLEEERAEINRAQLSRAAMAREATNPEQEIHPC